MESEYPRLEQASSKSWVVDVLAAILATFVVTPLLLFLVVPKLVGVFSALGNDRLVSLGVGVEGFKGWWLIGAVFTAAVGLFIYLRRRGPSGPKLTIKRVVWLTVGLTLALVTFVAFTLFQAIYMSGDMVK